MPITPQSGSDLHAETQRLYEDTLQQSLPSDIGALLQKIEQAERERTLREQ